MNLDLRRTAVAAAAVVALLATSSDQGARAPTPEYAGPRSGAVAIKTAEGLIMLWPDSSRAVAGALVEKYGPPDQVVSSQLSWYGRRPWARIVVFRDPDSNGRYNHLLESVAYGKVPFNRWQGVTAFGRGAAYDPGAQELSARTNGEGTNLLALNLADEVIRGRRTSAEARAFYDATVDLALSGKSSPYMSRLLFRPRGRLLPKVKNGVGP